MAVVKADAYGHGVKETVSALNSLKQKQPEYYAVAIAEEAVELREYKVKQPVLVFEPFVPQQAELVFKYNILATVFEERHLRILLNARKNIRTAAKSPVRIHIKVDTGMGRLGVKHGDAFEFIKKTAGSRNFIIDGIYTHFATSDEKDKRFANTQLDRFKLLIKKLDEAGINYGLAHAANSGAILDMPDSYFDMVRPGISLYGYYPSEETTESIALKPVMSLISSVASVKEIIPGESVSYGRKFIAKKKTKVATVPVGYADGYNRNLTNSATAAIKGKLYKQIGRVTMDRIMLDVGYDGIMPGDKVILLGREKGVEITAWDWGKILDTIPYEITCNISKRVPRIYKH